MTPRCSSITIAIRSTVIHGVTIVTSVTGIGKKGRTYVTYVAGFHDGAR